MSSGMNWARVRWKTRSWKNGTVGGREINERYRRRRKRKKRKGATYVARKNHPKQPAQVMSKAMEEKLIKQIQGSTRQQINIICEKNRRRKSMGVGAKDSLWLAEHEEPYDYADLLGRFWEFNRNGTAAFSWKRLSRVVVAKKCEYVCFGFPPKIVAKLKQQIEVHKARASLPTCEIEKKLVQTLSSISYRHKWTFVPGGLLRQIFYINRTALNRAAEFNPREYSYL
jgi:hypothetical protein